MNTNTSCELLSNLVSLTLETIAHSGNVPAYRCELLSNLVSLTLETISSCFNIHRNLL